MAASISVCVLCYGNYPDLAKRCLESISAALCPEVVMDVRVGLNEVSCTTEEFVYAWAATLPVMCAVYPATQNIYKYPMMRRMFYGSVLPLPLAERIMWFDDDSFLMAPCAAWWRAVEQRTRAPGLTGAVYTLTGGLRGQQYLGIKTQPWYGDKPVARQHRPTFCQGGWWVAHTDFLTKWDYPFPELQHNGGDSILGELCRQQDYPMQDWKEGVAINADAYGRESKAARRGASTLWPWQE